MSRSLLSIALLAILLAGCGDHSSSAGPRSSDGVRTTRMPATTSPLPSRIASVDAASWRLPYPVARAAVVRTGHGSVILAGGLLDGDRSTSRVLSIGLLSGRVEQLPGLAVPVHDTAGGMVAGAPTVVGGGNATEQSVVQSRVRGRWLRVGNLPTTRSDLAVEEWRGSPYVIGGYDGKSVPRTVLRLSRGAAPRPIATLLRGVRYAATARLHSDVYVFGGEVAGRELGTVQDVDLATGHTRPAGHLPRPLGHAMAVTVGDRILLMGGRTAPDRQTGRMWWYDPTTRRFRSAGRLPDPVSDAAVASYRRHVWLLGGETPAVTDRVTEVTLR
ncbi:kelch repeat-containing protein [Nocardioides sp.]|uniref:kelch repeat-containing protein n=1 Tax=Nocardioides sp. TaxID=35761 RepID=UPI002F3ED079